MYEGHPVLLSELLNGEMQRLSCLRSIVTAPFGAPRTWRRSVRAIVAKEKPNIFVRTSPRTALPTSYPRTCTPEYRFEFSRKKNTLLLLLPLLQIQARRDGRISIDHDMRGCASTSVQSGVGVGALTVVHGYGQSVHPRAPPAHVRPPHAPPLEEGCGVERDDPGETEVRMRCVHAVHAEKWREVEVDLCGGETGGHGISGGLDAKARTDQGQREWRVEGAQQQGSDRFVLRLDPERNVGTEEILMIVKSVLERERVNFMYTRAIPGLRESGDEAREPPSVKLERAKTGRRVGSKNCEARSAAAERAGSHARLACATKEEDPEKAARASSELPLNQSRVNIIRKI
ncbi:hypothetical protein B0H11DRAFT_2306616 [Mycena galericulata]|nr:hypothetical protein B0H11DRAFT_2306616 [Mycena galericulata]